MNLYVSLTLCLLAGSGVRSDGDLGIRKSPKRLKRTLVFPDPSTVLLIFGLGIPLQLDRENVIFGSFMKFIYNLPANSTDFVEPSVYYAKSNGNGGSRSRWSLYKVVEKLLQVYGLGGKGCLLRSICQAHVLPFDSHHGLAGQFFQILLTPSSTEEKYDQYEDREYHAAENLGKRGIEESCRALYPECTIDLLDVFSKTRFL